MSSSDGANTTRLLPKFVQTKIPILDDYLGAGFRVGSVSAFWSEVEVEASAIVLQTVQNRAKEGDRIIFITTTKRPKQILQSMKDLGFDTSAMEIDFIDAYSSLAPAKNERPEPGVVCLTSSNDTGELKCVVRSSLELAKKKLEQKKMVDPPAPENSAILVAFDSFSAYLDRFDSPAVALELLTDLREIFAEVHAVGLFVFTQWSYDQTTVESIRSTFDRIIELKATSDNPVYSLSVFAESQTTPVNRVSTRERLAYFKVLKPGGVKIYIPKIVVTGPFHAGKTSFIHSASHGAVSADRLGTTVALDFAHVSHRGFLIDIFGTPGQSRFDPLLQKLGARAVGVILFVSATDSIGLNRVRQQMRIIKSERLPYVVAVNKVNLRGALSLTAVRNLMGISSRVPIIPLRAKNLSEVRPNHPCELDSDDVANVLDKVVLQITKSEGTKS